MSLHRDRGVRAALAMFKLAALPPGMSPAAFKAALRGGQGVAQEAAGAIAHNPFKPLPKGAVPVAGKVDRSAFERGFARTPPPGADPAAFTAGQFEWLGKGQLPPQAVATGALKGGAPVAAQTAAELPLSPVAQRLQALRPTRA